MAMKATIRWKAAAALTRCLAVRAMTIFPACKKAAPPVPRWRPIDGTDSLSGGDGDDTLLLGPGDFGAGGAGDDLFQIDHTREDLSNVSHVTDFNAGDSIEIHHIALMDANGQTVAAHHRSAAQ